MKNYDQKIADAVSITEKLAVDLGRTPLKLELMNILPRHTIDVHCGGYEKLLSMAGLNPHSHLDACSVRTKPTNEIFRKPIPEKLSNKQIANPKITLRGLIAGDMHLPWIHQPTLDKFLAFNRQEQPDYVVQVGDLFDMYAHARFPKSMNLYTPKDEEKKALEKAQEFWFQVHKDNPKAKKYQLKGNHDIRPVKQALAHLPSIEHFVESYMEQLFKFDNVHTVDDHREIFRIDGIGFHHGYLGQLGAHRDTMLENMVVGHTHTGGVVYRGLRGRTIFELNVGLMGDPSSKCMSYTPAKEDKQTLGFGFIDPYGPRFICT